MNTKALIIAAVAATFTSGAAFAQSYERDYRNDRYEQNDRTYRGDRYDHNQRAQYGYDRRYDRNDRYDHSRRGYERRDYGYNYNHGSHYRVRRGEYLAHQYRGSRYVVSDWRGRRLYAPPRGHHWVQTGNDYALVALATGLIAQVLLSN